MDIGLAVVGVFAVIFLIVGLIGPMYAQLRLRDWREPTESDRQAIDDREPQEPVSLTRTVVIETVGEASVEVAIRGPPGYRVLFISDYVLEELDSEVGWALLSAEMARVRLFYRDYQVVAAAIAIALGTAAFLLVIPFELGFGGLLVVAALMLTIGRRLQYRADRVAAETVGAAELADAFETIGELHGADLSSGGWRTYLEVQPPLGDRIERLRDQA